MGDKKQHAAQDFCYDFPEVVIHRPECERYRGGICRPLPTPVKPYLPEEERVVASYEAFKAGEVKFEKFVRASGDTGPVVGEVDDEVREA